MIQHESILQQACVSWFKLQYPHLRYLFFAIPNAQKRERKQNTKGKWYTPSGNKQVAEGLLAGVADTFLAVPRNCFHGLFVEFKAGKGKQTEAQATFEKEVVNQGYDYKVARSSDEFIDIIKKYLR